MNKFNKTVILFSVFLLAVSFVAAKKTGKEILFERLENEKTDVAYRLQVVSEEEHAILLRILNLKIQMMKLRTLTKSAGWLKESCPSFKERCLTEYGMVGIYFRKDQKDISRQIIDAEEQLKSIEDEKNHLNKRVADLKKGFVIDGEKQKPFRVKIPELKGLFSCSKLRGWNSYRGVFIDEAKDISLPIDSVVDSVVAYGGKTMLTLDTGTFFVSFAYVDKVFVKTGEQLPAGKILFSGSRGNPLKKETVLMFIAKNDLFIYSQFVCK